MRSWQLTNQPYGSGRATIGAAFIDQPCGKPFTRFNKQHAVIVFAGPAMQLANGHCLDTWDQPDRH